MHSLLANLAPPPDLLHRFVETPFHARLRLGKSCVRVASNQHSVISALSRLGTAECDEAVFQWRVIVDSEAGPPERGQTIMTNSGSVITAWFGNGNLLSSDWDCGEAYAFLALDHEEFAAGIMAPLLASWIEQPSSVEDVTTG